VASAIRLPSPARPNHHLGDWGPLHLPLRCVRSPAPASVTIQSSIPIHLPTSISLLLPPLPPPPTSSQQLFSPPSSKSRGQNQHLSSTQQQHLILFYFIESRRQTNLPFFPPSTHHAWAYRSVAIAAAGVIGTNIQHRNYP
jgi:hypothetical protein